MQVLGTSTDLNILELHRIEFHQSKAKINNPCASGFPQSQPKADSLLSL
jgi:hypothetical protein